MGRLAKKVIEVICVSAGILLLFWRINELFLPNRSVDTASSDFRMLRETAESTNWNYPSLGIIQEFNGLPVHDQFSALPVSNSLDSWDNQDNGSRNYRSMNYNNEQANWSDASDYSNEQTDWSDASDYSNEQTDWSDASDYSNEQTDWSDASDYSNEQTDWSDASDYSNEQTNWSDASEYNNEQTNWSHASDYNNEQINSNHPLEGYAPTVSDQRNAVPVSNSLDSWDNEDNGNQNYFSMNNDEQANWNYPSDYNKEFGATVSDKFKDEDVFTILSKLPAYSQLKSLVIDSGGLSSFGPKRLIKKVRMTVFVPTNTAIAGFLNYFASVLEDDLHKEGEDSDEKSLKKKFAMQMITTHTTRGKIIFPDLLKVGEPVVAVSRSDTNITVVQQEDGNIIVDGHAKVIIIYTAKNGFIYEIDSMLKPSYNEGPSIKEFVENEPELSIARELMVSSGMISYFDYISPITHFIPSNFAFKNTNGSPMPSCLLNAIKKPENRGLIIKMISHSTVFGEMLTIEKIEKKKFLEDLYGKHLQVTHVDSRTFINNISISKTNIPVRNGYVHFIDKLLVPEGVDIKAASYWTCLDEHLRENPRHVKFILGRVDRYNSLPKIGVPPGPRPAWVAKGLRKYFPPGTTSARHFIHRHFRKPSSEEKRKKNKAY